jgi:hypothetical protein
MPDFKHLSEKELVELIGLDDSVAFTEVHQ